MTRMFSGATASVIVALLAALASLAGCAGQPPAPVVPIYSSFEDYRRDTVQRLASRHMAHGHAGELAATLNAPQEWRPPGPLRGGVLLVHGLGDSPWSFHDLGPALARQGFHVRTVLLPGHGTVPEDMLAVTLEDWQQVVAEQAALLAREAAPVLLGGFSTGANLALDHAHAHPGVAGLLLFSPAFRSSVPLGWVSPWLRHVKPWLIEPAPGQETLLVRYANVPTNGFAQYHRSSRLVQRHLQAARFDKPVLMVLAAADSVVDTDHAVKTFRSRFTHPASRLLWYGRAPDAAADDRRVMTLPDVLPEWRISQFSHKGVLFAPDNPLYGHRGRLRLCRNSRDDQATRACEQSDQVWFSEWGYREAGKVHARLTFNPYFEWQVRQMADVLDAAAGEPGPRDAEAVVSGRRTASPPARGIESLPPQHVPQRVQLYLPTSPPSTTSSVPVM